MSQRRADYLAFGVSSLSRLECRVCNETTLHKHNKCIHCGTEFVAPSARNFVPRSDNEEIAMPDIEQIKQDATNVVNAAKSAEEKVIAGITAADVEAAKVKQATMVKLNQEESWIEKNPKKVTVIVLALVVLIVAMLAKGCA